MRLVRGAGQQTLATVHKGEPARLASLTAACAPRRLLAGPCPAAPEGIGEGGVLLSECGEGGNGDSCSTDVPPAAADPGAAMDAAEKLGEAPAAAASPTSVCQQEELPGSASSGGQPSPVAEAAAAADDTTCEGGGEAGDAADDYVPAGSFAGARAGYVFRLGELGLGYYLDGKGTAAQEAAGQVAAADSRADQRPQGLAAAAPEKPSPEGEPAAAATTTAPAPAPAAALDLAAAASAARPAVQLPPSRGPRHHWGQALQYLERAVGVQPGRKVALLAHREGGKVRFGLRQGVGEYVGRPPWKIEWGGGSSVENPHFQRVHYCQLLVRSWPRPRKAGPLPAGCCASPACRLEPSSAIDESIATGRPAHRPPHHTPQPSPAPAPRLSPRHRSATSCSACAAAASLPSRRTCAWCWRTAARCCWTRRRCRR